MRLAYHPLVQRDVSEILEHYDALSPRLGDEFWAELLSLLEAVRANPGRFHLVGQGLRRANLRRFPFHLLFRVGPDSIRVIVVRHHRRHPGYGTQRQ